MAYGNEESMNEEFNEKYSKIETALKGLLLGLDETQIVEYIIANILKEEDKSKIHSYMFYIGRRVLRQAHQQTTTAQQPSINKIRRLLNGTISREAKNELDRVDYPEGD